MKTIKTVIVKPEFVFGNMPPVSEMKENTIYISKKYKTAIHRCLCGCGQETVTPLIEGQWILTLTNDEQNITLTPSIGNYQFPCKSHYVIVNNKASFI